MGRRNGISAGWEAAETMRSNPLRQSTPIRLALILVALVILSLFLFAPLLVVFGEALSKGVDAFLAALADDDAMFAIGLTCLVACLALPFNVMVGLCAAWCVAKFDFRGKSLLVTLIDLPFSVSPVIAGLIFVLLFGLHGWFGAFLAAHQLQVIFALPGIVLVTLFVTFPFVARELTPLMEQQGTDDEEAAVVLGANGWQVFRRVTLPNVKWGLLYGVLLCNARAIGEFGAVSVVSGHIIGRTTTMPLQVEILYNDYNFVGAFALSSVLALLALVTLALKSFFEWRYATELAADGRA